MSCEANPTEINRERVIEIAKSWIGTPYHHQSSKKDIGTDCLGLIRGVWRDLYGCEPEQPPAYTPDWNERHWSAAPWRRVTGTDPLLEGATRHLRCREDEHIIPGDVLVFRISRHGPAKHCGILSADDRFIHAYAGREVVEGWLNRWWRSRIAGVFSFPGSVPWRN